MDNNNSYSLIASAILFIGCFTPIFSTSGLNTITYFNNGNGEGLIVCILTIISALLVLTNQKKVTAVTGILILSTLIFTFVNFYLRLNSSLHNNQIQWGWALLIIGALLLLYNAIKNIIQYFLISVVISIILGFTVSYSLYAIEDNKLMSKIKQNYYEKLMDEFTKIIPELSKIKSISDYEERKNAIIKIFMNTEFKTNEILYSLCLEKASKLGIRIIFVDGNFELNRCIDPTDKNIDKLLNFIQTKPDNYNDFFIDFDWFNKEYIIKHSNYGRQ